MDDITGYATALQHGNNAVTVVALIVVYKVTAKLDDLKDSLTEIRLLLLTLIHR